MVKTLIDSAAGLVIHTTTGDMSVEEIETAIEARLESPEFRPGMKVLWDFRGAAISSLTTQGVQDLLAFNIQKAGARGGGKSAMVASEDAAYGIARMFEAYAQDLPWHTMVFRDLGSAMQWLNEPA